MIQESIRIRLNQFMLAYERQCAELQFQRQNIKQNVMLSIIQSRNAKKNLSQSNLNNVQKSMTRSKINQDLSISKETKISQHRKVENKNAESDIRQNQYEEVQKSKLMGQNSRLMQRSNISIKDNRSGKLTNNFINQNASKAQQPLEQPVERQRKSGLYNNPYYIPKEKQIQVEDMNDNNEQKIITFSQKSLINLNPNNKDQNRSQVSRRISQSQLNQQQNILSQSSISKRSNRIPPKLVERQLQQAYEVDSQSQVFPRSTKSRVYGNSQKVIRQNPSLIHAENQDDEPVYPTFQKPSFQFITNLSQLRQSNPHQVEDEQEQQQEHEQEQYQPYEQAHQEQEQAYGKWKSKTRNNQQLDQQQNDIQPELQTFNQGEQNISDIHQDESMMMASQFNQQQRNHIQQPRKSYLAFQINMEKSNLPPTQTMEELKKKKILQLQRKRQQRIENNSRRKQNPSEIANTPKPQNSKAYSNVFIGNKNTPKTPKRETDNRDSLNKSINEKKNDIQKNTKNSRYKEEEVNKESVFHDNRTIMTKYGEQSKINNRSTSPLNTVKTIQTDKRPPLNRNKKDDNIFAGESTFQRQRSSQKLTADPKIIPIDRKNSFQKKSNIKIMTNAITYTCLPGELSRRERQKLIDVLEDYENQYFIFLFKEYSRKVIKGIYILDGNQEKIVKIYGDKAPAQIVSEQVHQFYRFDSGSRQFKKIDGCKSFSFSIHAVDLR